MNPLAARLRAAMLTGRKRPGVRGTGAPVKRRSDGYEFAELRAYVSGDDPRRIDWAATARAGALQTRVVFEDHALTLATALDAALAGAVLVAHEPRDLALAWIDLVQRHDLLRVDDRRVEPGLDGVLAQQVGAEGVDGADLGGLQPAQVVFPAGGLAGILGCLKLG